MLSWSESSSDEEGDQELKEIKKQVISHRRNLPVVHEPQKLSRKVDPHKITPKFLKVTTQYYYIIDVITNVPQIPARQLYF